MILSRVDITWGKIESSLASGIWRLTRTRTVGISTSAMTNSACLSLVGGVVIDKAASSTSFSFGMESANASTLFFARAMRRLFQYSASLIVD